MGALGAAVFDLGDNACESHIQGPFLLLPEYLQNRAALQYQMSQRSISNSAWLVTAQLISGDSHADIA